MGDQLTQEFGRGFEAKNLLRMVQFAQIFAEPEIVATLSRQLSWSHFVNLLPLKTEQARQFYAGQAASQTWSVRELRQQIERKAFGAVSPIIDVLELIPGAQPELIESSCCGMAGSFGYEASHYNVSMQMAELSLLPAVRKQPDAVVVADGTSCRHQIKDGAAREAVHVAVLLARQLG